MRGPERYSFSADLGGSRLGMCQEQSRTTGGLCEESRSFKAFGVRSRGTVPARVARLRDDIGLFDIDRAKRRDVKPSML